MEQILGLLKEAFTISPVKMVTVLVKTSPAIIAGVLLNLAIHKWNVHQLHKELRKQGKGYLIDTGKNPKRPLDEPHDCSASVRGDVEEGTNEGR